MVNRCWDLIFIKLDTKPKFSSKPIFDLALGLDLIFLQIRWSNPRDQFESYIQFILNYLPMIHTMQLFNLIKSSIKNLINLLGLHCCNHPRQFEDKNPQISINQSIGSNYLCNSSSILSFTIDLASRFSLLWEKRDFATHAWRFDLTRHVWTLRK